VYIPIGPGSALAVSCGSVACKLTNRSCSRNVPIAVLGLLATLTAKRGALSPGSNGSTTARLAWSYPLVTTITRSFRRVVGTPSGEERSAVVVLMTT
jgi:hypothetical protein